MDTISELRSQGFNVEGNSGDYLLPNKHVDNDPRKPIVETFNIKVSEEQLERNKFYDERTLGRRFDNFTNGVNIMENIQRVDINLMTSAPGNWAYLPLPNESELLSLMSSIETIGLINPIILLKEPNYDKFTILDGKSRAMALMRLNSENPSDKYKYPICYILDANKVDQYYQRSLILDLNLSYRTIPQDAFIRMLLERHELLKRSKQYRSESNIAEKLAEEFFISKSSVYNYLALKKLTEEVMTLVYEKRISLQVAKLFTKIDHEVQIMILENIDFKDINCFHRMKFIIGNGEGKKTLEFVKKQIELSKNLVPEEINFNVTINKRLLDKISEGFIDLKQYAAKKFTGTFGDNIDRFCKIKFDEKQIHYFVEQNLIEEKTVAKLGAKTLREVMLK